MSAPARDIHFARWTPEAKEMARQLFEAGLHAEVIATRVGLSVAAIKTKASNERWRRIVAPVRLRAGPIPLTAFDGTDKKFNEALVEAIRAHWKNASKPIEIWIETSPQGGTTIRSRTIYGNPVSAAQWKRAQMKGLVV